MLAVALDGDASNTNDDDRGDSDAAEIALSEAEKVAEFGATLMASDSECSAYEVVFRFLVLAARFFPVCVLFTASWVFPGLTGLYYTCLTNTLEASGPLFIKLGQWASTRLDLFSPDFCRHLSRLQGDSEPHSFAESRAIIEAEFGKDLDDLFVEFDPVPIGSGCIAQVHRGTMRLAGDGGDGTQEIEVAVKVVHPNIHRRIATDVRVLRSVSAFLHAITPAYVAQWVDFEDAVQQFESILAMQVDMRDEAANLVKFMRMFRDHDQIEFPLPISGFVSSSVLVESFEHGTPIAHHIRNPSKDNAELAKLGLSMVMEMIFTHNFIHGDLHPGNLLVRRNAKGKLALVVLDAGIVCHLSDQDRVNFEDLFFAIVNNDGAECGRLMLERGTYNKCTDPVGFTRELDRIVRAAGLISLSEVDIGYVLMDVVSQACNYRVRLETNFAQLVLAIMILEGLGKSLDPSTNILTVPSLLDQNAARKRIRMFAWEYVEAEYWRTVDLTKQLFRNLVAKPDHTIEAAIVKAVKETDEIALSRKRSQHSQAQGKGKSNKTDPPK
jgi:aarF domain-containing kinase